jgi:hypothetical protein
MIDMKSTTLSSFTTSESAQKLIHGEIDVAIFLEGWESPAVQQLLKAKNVTLENISRADAFASLFPFLNKLVLPAGVLDVVEPRPPTDTLLIAPKFGLVIRKDLHPAIQYLLLEAAGRSSRHPGDVSHRWPVSSAGINRPPAQPPCARVLQGRRAIPPAPPSFLVSTAHRGTGGLAYPFAYCSIPPVQTCAVSL